jgi:hypothetical protein
MAKKVKGNLPRATPEEAKKILDRLDKQTVDFVGHLHELEQALGFYLLGRHVGWKVLVLIHNKRTIRKFEQILDINIRDEFPELGPDCERSEGYQVAKKLSNFWKAVSGDISIENRQIAS